MKRTLNLFVSISLLIAAVGCETASTASSAPGAGGGGGGGGEAGMGGAGGMAGMGGTAGMGGEGGTDGGVPDLLSGWGLFTDIRNQVPAPGVIPFEVTSPLFTDGALKHRFVTLTKGGTIAYSNDTSRWDSPVGTIYAKTFAFPPNLQDPETDGLEQLVETRLMVHVAAEDDRLNCGGAESCWQVHVYVYDEEQTDAERQTGGWTESITYTDPTEKECSDDQSPCESDEDCTGIDATCYNIQETVPDYAVPSNGACRRCHGVDGPNTRTRTLGPSTGMLNRGNDHGDEGEPVANQIDQLFELGMLAPEPGPEAQRTTYVDPVPYTEACQTPACIHEAARSYFDSNCSHCHAPDGEAAPTGIFLDYASMDPTNPTAEDFAKWGVCKGPTSGGGIRNCGDATANILPGDPDLSILLCRMDSVKIGEMMAPLGRSLIDFDGYDLIRQWITILPILFPDIPTSCSSEGTGGAGGAGTGGVGGAGI